jgi:hypothetical protein
VKFIKILSFCFIIILSSGCCYHIFKAMPEGTNYESEYYYVNEDEVDFLYDLTYKHNNEIVSRQEIFDTILDHIDSAETYILIDMFLFNSYIGAADNAHREITKELTDKLIRKKKDSAVQIDFITDPVNTVYEGADSNELLQMEKAGINVIVTNLNKLPDSNLLYSVIWRTLFQWMGNSKGCGLLPHPFSSDEERVTIRSYLTLLNFKANHRKVFAADFGDTWVTVVSSANPHAGSSAHSNTGLLIYGDFAEEIFKTENSVADFSKEQLSSNIETERDEIEKEIKIKLITEERIKENLLNEVNSTTGCDSIKMGMFYLSDRDIVKSLLSASERDVSIKIILDPNKDAFGRKKQGIPNRPVAYELVTKSNKKIQLKWYSTYGEQFHSKIVMIQRADETATVIIGSANLTKRNIGSKNLEMNVVLKASNNSETICEIQEYFHLIWNDEKYTLSFEAYEVKSRWMQWVYRFTEFWGAATY